MFVNAKRRREIALIHFVLFFINATQVDDRKTVKNETNKKREKEIKHLIAIRSRIQKRYKEELNLIETKITRTIVKAINKKFHKIKIEFKSKLESFESLRRRKGLDSVYVDFDFVVLCLLNAMKNLGYDFVSNDDIKHANELVNSYIRTEMSDDDKKAIIIFFNNLVGAIEDEKI